MITSTGPFCGSSLSPSCSFKASMNVGPDSSGWKFAPGGKGPLNVGVNSITKSNLPVSPVLSSTGRSTPVNGEFIEVVIIVMGTFRAPTRIRPGAFAGGHALRKPQASGNPPATVGTAPGPDPGAGGATEQAASAGCC